MSATIETSDIQVNCEDFAQFQDALKQMRTTDDKIINVLNTTIPTASFKGEVDASARCESLYAQLHGSYTHRDRAIRSCITHAADAVATSRQRKADDPDSLAVMKTLRKEQTRLRLMQNELSIEEIIMDRTLKVFQEKCRNHYKPTHGLKFS